MTTPETIVAARIARQIDFNKRRMISQTTHLKCAKCGGDNVISNRDVLPWKLEVVATDRLETWAIHQAANPLLFCLVWTCSCCGESYDLGLLKYDAGGKQ